MVLAFTVAEPSTREKQCWEPWEKKVALMEKAVGLREVETSPAPSAAALCWHLVLAGVFLKLCRTHI